MTGATPNEANTRRSRECVRVGAGAASPSVPDHLERSGTSGSFKLETAFPRSERPAGNRAGRVEGLGTLESADDVPGLRRIDVRDVDTAIASATRQPLLTAFRYQRSASAFGLAMSVTRFPTPPSRGDRRSRNRDHAAHQRRSCPHRDLSPRSQSGTGVHEGGAAAGAKILSVDIAGHRRNR